MCDFTSLPYILKYKLFYRLNEKINTIQYYELIIVKKIYNAILNIIFYVIM